MNARGKISGFMKIRRFTFTIMLVDILICIKIENFPKVEHNCGQYVLLQAIAATDIYITILEYILKFWWKYPHP